MTERKTSLLLAGLLLAAVTFAYWPALGSGLLALDDREILEQELPDSAVVVAIPNTEYFQQLQGLGRLRDDLRFTKTTPADYLLLLARRALFTPAMAGIYGTVPPILAVELDGVELVGLYRWVEPADPDDENEETQ